MMKAIKNLCVLLLTAAIIVAAAQLPKITAVLQDSTEKQQAQYGEISSIQLDIQKQLTIIGKLSLVPYLDSWIEISEADASMSMSEVNSVVMKAFEPYYAAELMFPMEKAYSEFRPQIVQNPDDPEIYTIIWTGQIVQDTEPYPIIELGIDDETGAILYINYNAGYFVYDEAELLGNIHRFSEIYFNALGITNYQDYMQDEIFYGDNINGITYTLDDAEYGKITMDFMSFGSGFYIRFS